MAQPTLLSVFPSFVVGGAQMRFVTLARLWGTGVRHRIVAMDGRLDARAALPAGLDVAFPSLDLRRADTAGNINRIAAYLAETRPDRLLTSNWGAIDWAMARRLAALRGARIPHAHTEDGFGPEERDRQLPRRVWTRRLVLRGSDVIVPSRTLERLARDVWRLPSARLHYVPNGIDLARFAAGAPALAQTLPPVDGPTIGTIAALRAEKNLGRLLDAFAVLRRARPARLVLVGDGAERPGLEARAAALGIAADTLFAGHSAEPERWMAAFDIFALSSDTEQMPLSVLEAMAAGKPVVSTDVGDVRAMLSPQNGAFIVVREAKSLAAALETMAANPDLRGQVGRANRAKAEGEYDEARMAARYATLLGLA